MSSGSLSFPFASVIVSQRSAGLPVLRCFLFVDTIPRRWYHRHNTICSPDVAYAGGGEEPRCPRKRSPWTILPGAITAPNPLCWPSRRRPGRTPRPSRGSAAPSAAAWAACGRSAVPSAAWPLWPACSTAATIPPMARPRLPITPASRPWPENLKRQTAPSSAGSSWASARSVTPPSPRAGRHGVGHPGAVHS